VNGVLEEDVAAFTPRYTHTAVELNNALYLFAGSDSPNANVTAVGLQDAWKSTDGRTWTPLQQPPFAARMEQATTVLNGRIYLAAGVSTTDYFAAQRFHDVWSTADGVSWVQETGAAPSSGRNSPILLNHGNRLYIIGGFSVSRTHDVWRSDDGTDWSVAFGHPIGVP
jgi:N-acetylneuraminic acid mutarotase